MAKRWRILIALLLHLLALAPLSGFADVIYKEVALGPTCKFKISRFWSVGKVGWPIPDRVREIIIDYDISRYTGKETVLDVTYIKSKRKASIDGAVQNSVHQMRSRPGVSNFSHTCSIFSIPNGNAKRCLLSYKKNNSKMYVQLLAYVLDNDAYAAYLFSGAYVNSYNKKVFDKLFSSLVCE